MFVKIRGKTHHLWLGVNQHGAVLDILVTSRCDAKAVNRFFREPLTGLEHAPRLLVTDNLSIYDLTHSKMMPGAEHRRAKYLNNRAENYHQPTRRGNVQ